MRRAADRASAALFYGAAGACVLLVLVVTLSLLANAWPLLAAHGPLALLLESRWRPSEGLFGFAPYVIGTLWVTGLAMALAVPVCLLAAIYLAEYAGRRLRRLVNPALDVLAGIPSVVIGLFGVLAVVPCVQALSVWLGRPATGYSVLAGGVVLAIMVAPFVIAVAIQVLRSVPDGAREASLALGATRWQTVVHVVLRRVAGGIVAAVVLGFSRAFGETMAVLMVVGNVARPPRSLFDPAYPLPALLANNYGELMSIPGYDAALMFSALLLMLLVLCFNLLARLVLRRLEARP